MFWLAHKNTQWVKNGENGAVIVIFYTEILMRKVVLWYFFTSETSKKIHKSTFQVKTISIECNFFKWDVKVTKIWHLIFHRTWKSIYQIRFIKFFTAVRLIWLHFTIRLRLISLLLFKMFFQRREMQWAKILWKKLHFRVGPSVRNFFKKHLF